ncbi:binding-protein-dependent transport systems inner membrane component [Gloeocapsa sp. PCC 7428]|uniref:ABC transporter permease n=1 Tax=Gloeocapsa sp. PCC 7428 TaxID=1173026 RepID=UPI0002A60E86|nr:iron ABC transporter permease [Gloeocapsa sp. PCC 7428]AFZ32820.1 binding-protein-dependent transport systems inner membrane component [Gloeocapsa sp. PCC 7428]
MTTQTGIARLIVSPQRFLNRWLGKYDFSFVFWIGFIVILLVLIGLPSYWLVLRSFMQVNEGGFTLSNYIEVLTNPRFREAALNSLMLATGTGVLSVLIGVPLAWATTRTNMPLRGLMRVLLLGAFSVPTFLGGIAWILLAAPTSGWLNRVFIELTGIEKGPLDVYTMLGAIFVVGIYSFQYVFLMVSSALEFVSSELEDAATVLGAGTFATTFRITLPLVLPAIISGFILSFLEAIALFGSPTLILIPARINIVTTEIWQQFQYPSNVELASAFSICLVVITAALLLLQRRLLARKGYTTLTGKAGRKRLINLGYWKWAFLAFCLLVATLSLFLPVYVLLRTALSKSWGRPLDASNLTLAWFEDVLFKQPFTSGAIQNTLIYAAGAATFAMLVGIVIAYIVNRKLVRFYRVLGFLPMLPLAIPGIVIAVGIFSAYSRPPLVLYGSAAILIIAFTTRFLPIAFSNAGNIFTSINPELELAARNLGATQATTVHKITVPLVQRGLISGWLLVFILSVRELSCAILLYTNNTQVISTALFQLVTEGSYERVAALGIVMLAIIFTTIGITYKFLGRDFMLEKG